MGAECWRKVEWAYNKSSLQPPQRRVFNNHSSLKFCSRRRIGNAKGQGFKSQAVVELVSFHRTLTRVQLRRLIGKWYWYYVYVFVCQFFPAKLFVLNYIGNRRYYKISCTGLSWHEINLFLLCLFVGNCTTITLKSHCVSNFSILVRNIRVKVIYNQT